MVKIFRNVFRMIKEIIKWIISGMQTSPPAILKQKIVKKYANKFSINLFVETGTFYGSMVYATKNVFEKIYSIELDNYFYKRAKNLFLRYKHISIIQGDSAEILPEIISKINQPCLFWLDAHYSGGNTAKGEIETPILQELNYILNNSKFDNVILIDDAQYFIGENDYPTLRELRTLISKKNHNYCFIVKNDIIRLHKKV